MTDHHYTSILESEVVSTTTKTSMKRRMISDEGSNNSTTTTTTTTGTRRRTNRPRRSGTGTGEVATAIISLVVVVVATAAFYPTSTSAFVVPTASNSLIQKGITKSSIIGTTASSSSSSSSSCLHVLSSPPSSKGDESPAPLFTLDAVEDLVPSLSKQQQQGGGGSGLYQVDEGLAVSVDVLPPSQQQQRNSNTNGNSNIRTIPTPIVDPDDFSFYYRDEDDILTEREDRQYTDEHGLRKKVERCILVAVEDLSAQRKAKKLDLYYDPLSGEADAPCFTLEESMVEMRELIRTAGLDLTGEITQRLQEANPKTYIGSGKVQEAKALMEATDCTTIVFDAELSPGQQKSLENIFNRNIIQNDFLVSDREIKVIDRTALILDIFAQHAKTREGKLQVDLALHEYRKPRLTKMWTHLERQSGAGGVGLRGPGESQLEIDRRLVRDRIIVLKQKIDDVQKQRQIHRRGRKRTGLPVMSLVGYTNAGKSSLLNCLCRAGVMADSMLFATLDPTTRKFKLPGERTNPEVLLTDTVGFIQKLPTHLVAAFRATLEEVEEADVLIHVIDVSNPSWEKQERAVRAVLSDMGIVDKPIVRVLNKIDLLEEEDAEYLKYESTFAEKTVACSALFGDGMDDFVGVIEEVLNDMLVPIEIEIPYNMGHELNIIHQQGVIETIDYKPEGTYVVGRVPAAVANRLERYSLIKDKKKKVESMDDTKQGKGRKTTNNDDGIDWVAIGRGRHSQE
jgi:GTP-binding protein HflX